MPASPTPVPPKDDDAFQIIVDEELLSGELGARVGTPMVLFIVGILATLLALRFGIFFFFLPIVPLGFGGGAVIRDALRRLRPRALWIHRGRLWSVTLGPFGPSRHGSIALGHPVVVSLCAEGGRDRWATRFESGGEVFWVGVSGFEHGRRFLERLRPFFDEAKAPFVIEGVFESRH